MGGRRINLLPAEERAKVKRERGLVYALLALILVVGVLGVLYVFENQRASTKRQEVASLQSRLTQLQQEVATYRPYEIQQSQRAAMSQVATQIYDSRVVWSSIAEEISLLIPEECRLTELQAAVPAPMLAGSALGGEGVAAAAAGTAPDMTLSGEALTHRDVAEFMTRLGLMPQLTDIQLVSATKAESESGADVVTFQITARLRAFQSQPPLAAAGAASQASGGEPVSGEAQ